MNLRHLRLAQRMTQADVAQRLGVHSTYVSKLEHNRVSTPPSDVVIARMADVYGVAVDDLCAYFGKLDPHALRMVAADSPVAASVLRRIQAGLTPEQWRRIGDIVDMEVNA